LIGVLTSGRNRTGIQEELKMKKWFALISITFLILAAATVLAVQNFNEVTVYNEVAPKSAAVSTDGYSGCGGASGCGAGGSTACGSAGSSGCGAPVDPEVAKQRVKSIQGYLFAYFSETLNDQSITVEVEDFGCHQEASILQDGKVIKRLSISGNSISEIRS
jgi:hypothetical protein